MSKRSKFQKYNMEEEGVYPHKHCPTCNNMMQEEEEYCSPECAGVNKGKDKKKKRKIIMFVGIYGVVIIAFILFMIFTR